MAPIAERCERLADAFEAKGIHVRSNLRPGLSRGEIIERASLLGMRVPDEVIELYQWHDGHVDDDSDEVITFRDNAFISIDRAVQAYGHIAEYYGAGSTIESDQVDLKACFPIAEFQGAWYVVACGEHMHGADKPHPIISVFQGVDMFYHSVSSMLDTAISWVSHPSWKKYDFVPDSVEMKIWKMHNPGIFPDRE